MYGYLPTKPASERLKAFYSDNVDDWKNLTFVWPVSPARTELPSPPSLPRSHPPPLPAPRSPVTL